MGSSVTGVLSAMRIVNLTMAGCMIALAVGQIIQSDSAFSVMADALSVIYTMCVQPCCHHQFRWFVNLTCYPMYLLPSAASSR